jgi:glycosyltransferase involved in cell wall biosynthesis
VSVTVAIPCYNPNGRLLYRCLTSVLQQTVLPLEVILVDDGSIQEVTIPNIPGIDNLNVKIIRITNRGLPNARNTALMNARGEAFLPLDFDDWLDPTYIEKTWNLLDGADVVLTGLKEHGPLRNMTYNPGYDIPFEDVTADLLLSTFNRFFYCSLFRTQTLKNAGGYNGRMVHGFEDWDLWIDLLRRGVKLRAIKEPLFNYDTSNPNSMLSSSMRMKNEIEAEIRRHHCA